MNKNTGITVRLEPRQAPNPPERSRRGTGWRNAAGALVAALSLASAGTLLADETFQDDTFAETPAGPWSEDGPYSVPDGGSFTFEQVATGGQGDDGPYGRVAVNYQTVSSGQTVTWGFIFNDQFVIDPAVDGEIDRVSADWIARDTPGVINGTAMMLAVRQDGVIWAALDGRQFPNTDEWSPFSQTQRTEADFTLNSAWFQSGQAANPDFSASGGPITFGLGFGVSCPASSDCRPQPNSASRSSAARASIQPSCSCELWGGVASAPRLSAPRMRSRISPAALRVKVMATISSGLSTTASSRKNRCVSNSVLPDPAGACTMKLRPGSSACRRTA